MISSHRRSGQNGSALLIVFVFAAIVAIMLYREMPVAAFEARRQKEQLLIDRGNEYKRAIKLYVRKFQTFPPSMEALENTNRMRFLRNRYVDPFTGKEDWRLLHAGPGGIILDSKIKQNQIGPGAVPGALSNSSSATAGTNSFGSSSFGSSVGFGAGATNANALPGNGSNGLSAANPFPMPPQATASDAVGSANGAPQYAQPNGSMAAPPGSSPDSGQAGGPSPISPSRFRNVNPTGSSNPPEQTDGTAQDPQAMLQALLNNQNPQQPATQQPSAFNNNIGNANSNNGPAGITNAASSSFGSANPQNGNNNMNGGGGIAGVASKTTGHTIKIINDQNDRSLWEFVYDMQKEAMANAPGLATGSANSTSTSPNGGISGTQATPTNPSGPNSPNQTNTFSSGYGTAPTPTYTPPPTNQ